MIIGSLKLKSNLLLAPLAGITCNAFRLLCKDYGAGMTYMPILNENAVINNPKNVVDVIENERPVGAQLIGNDALKLSKAARMLEPYVDLIDLNLGCSCRKEIEEGTGSILLRKPDKVRKLVSSLVSSVSIPVTAKIRLGFKENNVMEISRLIEDAGAKALTIHARLGVQDYSVKADWSWIKKVKENSRIPIIGNGDALNPFEVKRMFDETDCDGVMLARGANGYPFIFKSSLEYLRTGVLPQAPSSREVIDAFIKFVNYYQEYNKKPSLQDVKMRAFWFVKGLKNNHKVRDQIMRAISIDDITELITNINTD